MTLRAVSDRFLAARTAEGDSVAFAELARRYRPLIMHVTRSRELGLELEDARQEALLALFQACLKHDPARGRFEGLANLCVRSRVRNARIDARRPGRRLLTEAYRDGDEPTRRLAERAAAPEGSDPAVVVELRDQLRERAQRARRKANAPHGDLRRRYSDQQIAHALALIADGKTLKETALAVGAPADRVARWVTRAGQPRPAGRRRYSGAEVREAISLVHGGASLRQAAAAVGASNRHRPARAAPGRMTRPPAPAPPAIAPELLGELAHRAARADFPRLEAQLRSSGYCARPVRLRGQIETCDGTGRRRVWSTDTEPDGILRKACGNRREAVCAPCAERYRGDAYQLIAAGLRGGKGIPETVTEHPAAFVTLTAPSFGVVHTRPLGPDGKPRRCRPRRQAPVCEHGTRVSCARVHDEDDPCLGEPLCADCFDHAGAVIWNNVLSELWRRTTIYLPRILARLIGMTQKRLREFVRVSYVKVAEYQRRGLVHIHAVIRLDRALPTYRATEVKPPPRRFGVDLLEQAIRATAGEVCAPLPEPLGFGVVRWGDELDVRPLDPDERREVAGYLAKYATKSTEQAGGVLHRVTEHELDALPVREHIRAYMREAFALARDQALTDRRFGPCAHTLGCRGHCLTKSRRYSTTFKALREDRQRYVHEQLLEGSKDAAQRAIAGATERVACFRYAGIGHITAADAYLAASAAARAREHRRLAREARAVDINTGGGK